MPVITSVYLISNAVSNAINGKFYDKDIPDLENVCGYAGTTGPER